MYMILEESQIGLMRPKGTSQVNRKGRRVKNLFIQYRTWFKIGLFTLGGGYAIIPMINKEVVQKYHWAENEEILDYYAVGQSLPGIIAVNTAVFVGYKISGVPGAIVSAMGAISPSIVLITIVAAVLSGFQDIPVVNHALNGIQIGVCVLMAATIIQLCKGSIKDIAGIVICLAAFALSYFAGVPIALLVVLSAIVGIVLKTISEKRKEEAKTKK